MVLEGTIERVVDMQEGVSQKGKAWKKATYVLTTNEQYPKKVAFSVFGEDRINDMSLIVGEEVRLGIDIESREWNGRWFTDVRAYMKLDTENGASKAQEPAPEQPVTSQAPAENTDELPF